MDCKEPRLPIKGIFLNVENNKTSKVDAIRLTIDNYSMTLPEIFWSIGNGKRIYFYV